MIGATDVFVSYKAEDRARLVPLVSALEAEGFSVWWDTHIGGGAHWRDDIQEHLEAAKCVIVAWTKRSVGPEGDFVRDEATRARKRGKYLPVRLDLVEPPLGFGEVQAISLKGWKGDRTDPRFIGVVEAVRRCVAGEDIIHVKLKHDGYGVSRRTLLVGGASAVAIAGLGTWFLIKPAPANAKRIAVLPFANLSGAQDQDYFAEGIAEELRSALSRIGLQVIGRESSEAVKQLDTKVAASKLGVGNILTGSVRRSPATIRINTQLLNGEDGVERWAHSYDQPTGDEIKIQTDIATNVAQSLSIALGQAGRAALMLGGTKDAAAQDLYLQARAIDAAAGNEDATRESIALLDAAIGRDPTYAEAYRLKSRSFEDLAALYPKGPVDLAENLVRAEEAARRAIELAPRLGSAHVALALVESDRFNFPSAVQLMRQGLALSPQDPNVVSPAALFMQVFGDGRKALELADRLIALDPLRARSYARRAEVLFVLRDYRRSIDASRKALGLAPQLSASHKVIADCLVLLNRFAQARLEYQKVPADDPLRLAGEAILAVRSRDSSTATQILERMHELFAGAASYQYAQIYAQFGNPNRAFSEFDNAVRAKDPGLQSLKVDPYLDPIRHDPRYEALLKRLDFPVWT